MNPQPVKPNKVNKDLVNERIPFKEVMLINEFGENLGVKSRKEALMLAEQAEMDLLCVAINAKPPVCKIINYGKWHFEQKKNEKKNRNSGKGSELKEIRFTPLTSEHDLQTKANQAIKMLQKGAKLKVAVFIKKGRMSGRLDLAENTLNRFIEMVSEYGQVDKQPVYEGKYYFCFISAIKK